jgi:Domain of unknown function (DUF1937)
MTIRKIRELVYVACPYTSPYGNLKLARTHVATLAAAEVAQSGKHTPFSPLTHGAPMMPVLPTGLVQNHDFWMDHDITILAACDILLVLPLDGWRKSKGVSEEIEFATRVRTPIKFWRDSRLLDQVHGLYQSELPRLLFDMPDLAERQTKGWKLWN